MKTILFLISLLLCFSASGQFKKKEQAPRLFIETNYIRVGESRQEFAEWAKSINKWYPADIKENPELNDSSKMWWDQQYTLRGNKVIANRYPSQIAYTYIFKGNECIQMIITPISFDGFQDEISREFEFVEKKEIQSGKQYHHVYKSNDGRYKLTVKEVISDNGFERKQGFDKVFVTLN